MLKPRFLDRLGSESETQLVRARNKVADSLDDCRRMIDDTLGHLR